MFYLYLLEGSSFAGQDGAGSCGDIFARNLSLLTRTPLNQQVSPSYPEHPHSVQILQLWALLILT